jgi:M6 family metalloprotease-like protein
MPGPDPTTARAPTRPSPTYRRHSASVAAVALAVGSLLLAASAQPASGSAGPRDDVVDLAPAPSAAAGGAGRARAASIPVYPGPFRVRQPDGSRVTVVAWGDARAHGYRSTGGHTVVKDASGVWRYAVSVDRIGRPVPSPLEVGRDEPPAAAKGLQAQLVAGAQASHTDEVATPGTGRGKQRSLVILVSFADRGPVGSTEAMWAERYFGASGSVAAYYRQNSFNRFRLRPAAESDGVRDNGVVGWLKLPYNHPDFGDNYNNKRDKLTVDALKAANRHVDFRSFDQDHDGHLSTAELHVSIIVAGYETSYGGEDDVCGPSVWGHNGALYSGGTKVDGVYFEPEGGSMQGEWMCRSTDNPGRVATIGGDAVMMGFDIGMPTLWDLDLSSAGLGDWSLMASGSWNRAPGGAAGSSPAMLDAFSKSYQGWIVPKGVFGRLDGAALPSSATSPTAYRLLANPGGVDWFGNGQRGEGEYFLVENRQQVGWDVGLPACGLIVYHVDEGVRTSSYANARDGHRLVDIVEASGSKPLDSYTYQGSAADVFPGSSGHLDFADTTSPQATLYSRQPSAVSMHVNGGCAPTMTANFFVPLANDAFTSATLLDGTDGLIEGGNSGATKQPGEPAVAGDPGGASIWYRFTAPADGELSLSTRGSQFDTLLGVYRGTSISALTKVAENDNSGTGTSSAVTATVERGKTYRIAIDGRLLDVGSDQGLSVLIYSFGPANDDLRQATRLTGQQGRIVSSTEGSGLEKKEPSKIDGQRADHSVWYMYQARQDGRLVLDLSGSEFDTLLAVYTGDKVSQLRLVAADDNSAEGKRSSVSVPVNSGTTYRIAVAGLEDAGKLVLRWHQ